MGRGRKPLPTAIKERNGAYLVNPERKNHEEPIAPQGEPEIPAALADDPDAAAHWKKTCKNLEVLGLLATTDGDVIISYAKCYAQWMRLQDAVKDGNVGYQTSTGNYAQRPEAIQVHRYADRLIKLMAELGLTPSSRSRMKAVQPKKEDPFLEWLAKDSGN